MSPVGPRRLKRPLLVGDCDSNRVLGCESYDVCLDLACQGGWVSFTCKRCERSIGKLTEKEGVEVRCSKHKGEVLEIDLAESSESEVFVGSCPRCREEARQRGFSQGWDAKLRDGRRRLLPQEEEVEG